MHTLFIHHDVIQKSLYYDSVLPVLLHIHGHGLNSILLLTALSTLSYFSIGNFWMLIPVFKYLYTHSKRGEVFKRLYNIALKLVKARRSSKTKVSISQLVNRV